MNPDRSAFVADLARLLLEAVDKPDFPGPLAETEFLFGPESRLALDSLDALQVSMAVQQAYGVRMTDSKDVRRAFATLGSLADYLLARGAKR